MFSQIQIDDWISLTDQSLSLENNDFVEMGLSHNGTAPDLKRFLVDLQIQVERWDLLTSHLIFNHLLEPYIMTSLVKEYAHSNMGTQIVLWGSVLIFSPFMPIDKVLAIDTQTLNPIVPKCTALGKIDIKQIERLHNLKAFW